MRFLALYTRAILKRSHYGRGHNSTFVLLSCVVTISAECLRLRRPPSLQLADIPSANQIKTLKEEKVNIIKDFL